MLKLPTHSGFHDLFLKWAVHKKMAPTCEKNVQIKLTSKNFLLIIFNVVYIEVNETRKKL
jgi:hypothetical protein